LDPCNNSAVSCDQVRDLLAVLVSDGNEGIIDHEHLKEAEILLAKEAEALLEGLDRGEWESASPTAKRIVGYALLGQMARER
jgi:hypothetical protein